MTIAPQPGYQTLALSSPADIVIGGSAAGVGKTFSLLLEPLKHITRVPNYSTVAFRRTYPQITMAGGLWDSSQKLYSLLKCASPKFGSLSWDFDLGKGMKNRLEFSHLQHEKDIYNYQGAEIALIMFDELTHFSETMFFYLMTRNRSTCGIKPKMVATCNPDPDSWVFNLVSWWIGDDGFPLADRQGKVRYFYRDGEDYFWGDSFQEVYKAVAHLIDPQVERSNGLIKPEHFIKSLEFVAGSIYDNKKLLEANPQYLANLSSQDEATRRQLLDGNWKLVVRDDELYNPEQFSRMFHADAPENPSTRYLTADIALMGSDKFVLFVWDGYTIIHAVIMAKSTGPQVLDTIRGLAKDYSIPDTNIIYDADGVGGFLGGFLPGAIGFNANATPLEVLADNGKRIKESYQNLKSQLFYRNSQSVNAGKYKVSRSVASMMYDERTTIEQRMKYERRVIRRAKPDHDGKLKIIPKEEQKKLINNASPDVIDAFAMREYFEFKPRVAWRVGR